MQLKETLFTNKSGIRNFEDGETFNASLIEDNNNFIKFNVSSKHVVERNVGYVVIDTGSDADL